MEGGRSLSAIEAGREALLRAAWAEARESFEAALAEEETAAALTGLGTAARGQCDGETALDAHERGYRLARRLGDTEAAAALAIELVFDCGHFRGAAEAGGWLERAGALLEGLPVSRLHVLHGYHRAHVALRHRGDPPGAQAEAESARRLARDAGDVDGEMVLLALEGLALVADGKIERGMPCLDQAAAVAAGGEVSDVRIVEVIYCHLIEACARVRDLSRVEEWATRVDEVSTRYGDVEMFATCRLYYADVLTWRGDWTGAGNELAVAGRELARLRRKAAACAVRVAELRRRQGRRDEAEALLAQADGDARAPLVAGALALDRGNAREAADEAERFVRRAGGDRFEAVAGRELLVRAALSLGDLGAAAGATEEIERAAALGGTAGLRAAALLARGRVAAAEGDQAGARGALEDAADLYEQCGAVYETAHARLALAGVLRALGREAGAERAETAARAALDELGAAAPRPAARGGDDGVQLTAREREVMGLLAAGMSNDEIARELVLSVRTVERHVANVYGKIGTSGRTARVVATAYAHSHGLV